MTRSGTGLFHPDRSHEFDPDSNSKPREYLFPSYQMGGIYTNIEKTVIEKNYTRYIYIIIVISFLILTDNI